MAEQLPQDSMKARLERAGVKTIYPEKEKYRPDEVMLEYNGKRISRPYVNVCEYVVKKAFGLEI